MLLKKIVIVFVLTLLVFASACSLPGFTVVNGTNPDPAVALQTEVANALASTSAAETALANLVGLTLTAMVTDTPTFTDTPQFTETPTLTVTPSLTPTPTFTITPDKPMVSVSMETNCRTGPGTAYGILGVVAVGQSAEIVGQVVGAGSWIIRLPSNPTIICWIWTNYATATGNTSTLPFITPPPTPTPKFTSTPMASFNVVYNSIENCGGTWGIKFKITNVGSITWESNRVIATDQSTSETNTNDRNNFPNYNEAGCALASADLNLEAGEVGYTSTTSFSANPAGHPFTATIRVCSLDGMAGTCLEKTITFTP